MYNVYTHVFLSPLPFFSFFVSPFSFSFPAPSSPLFLPTARVQSQGGKGVRERPQSWAYSTFLLASSSAPPTWTLP